jgi:hypothetical protein
MIIGTVDPESLYVQTADAVMIRKLNPVTHRSVGDTFVSNRA